MKTDYTKAKLYYVYFPKLNLYKLGCTSTALNRRMTSLGLAGKELNSKNKEVNIKTIENVDYIVKFLREYKRSTAYEYESIIKKNNQEYRVAVDCTPLNNGNSELYKEDIGDCFIDSIPKSDL